MEKTSVFNLIILDESGSMSDCRKATIDGCNETINMVKAAQTKYADTQRHFISIYAFQSNDSCPSHYICKNVKAEDAKHIGQKDYKPWGATPLLDAIGTTVNELRTIASTHEDGTGVVTIITDGYENSSREYDWQGIRRLISSLKEIGWQINFIGANIDVDAVADRLHIDSRMAFTNDSVGTKAMFTNLSDSMDASYACMQDEAMCVPTEKINRRKLRSGKFFDNLK